MSKKKKAKKKEEWSVVVAKFILIRTYKLTTQHIWYPLIMWRTLHRFNTHLLSKINNKRASWLDWYIWKRRNN